MKRPWVAGLFGAGAILVIAIGLMVYFQLLPVPADDTGAKTLAAVLGLIGAILSAVVTLFGTILKYSIDERNLALAVHAERRNDIEAERSHNLAVQAERRNDIEARRNHELAAEEQRKSQIDVAIRAVDLLSENCQDSTQHQIGGALLALVSLGELDLAVALLGEMWPGKTSPAVAEVVLNEALKGDSEEVQISASSVLSSNASQIDQGTYHIWPIPDHGWRVDLPDNCRVGMINAASKWLQATIPKGGLFSNAAAVLYKALEDDEPMIAEIAAACLEPVVKVISSESWTYEGARMLTALQVAERLEEFPKDEQLAELAQHLHGERIGELCAEWLAGVSESPAVERSSEDDIDT